MLRKLPINFAKWTVKKVPVQQKRFNSQQKEISPHIMFYKNYARPLGKVTLFALATYYGLEIVWWKLDASEQEAIKNSELRNLENAK
ncbi:mitochondrial F1-FO ATP synthase peripheral stalk assembly factor Ina17 [Schizosaccharomyces pombe]|uniref:Inner membrane assembly complex subunit 17 n=1 Tax=Schizosaccharomyces pombe (strain 972 / ATCC 24843) TaxID=284812 RepID=INA17_SCHPO